mgnify:CR=1 FL=1|jgi:hypothetical protein
MSNVIKTTLPSLVAITTMMSIITLTFYLNVMIYSGM